MTTSNDVLLTVNQIIEQYAEPPHKVTLGAVRLWIRSGAIKPVIRQGKGRDGAMYFSRADVQAIVYGTCKACGAMFKRSTRKQEFCGRLCRDRFRYRIKSAEAEHHGKFVESRAPIARGTAAAAAQAAELAAKLKAMAKRKSKT